MTTIRSALDSSASTEGPRAGVEAFLGRVGEVNSELNAFWMLNDPQELRAAADASAARWAAGSPLSALDGMLVSIKDNIAVTGQPKRQGSALIDATPAQENAPVVDRMLEAGMIIVGRTTMPDHGCKAITHGGLHGTTRNPWDSRLTSGGSSGGAAASVGAGLTRLAIGSDGGGSIRVPAAFCGVVGLKPTFDRVKTLPGSPFGTLSHQGPIAASAVEAAALFEVIAQTHVDLAAGALDQLTYAVWEPSADVAVPLVDGVARVVEILAGSGATRVAFDLTMDRAKFAFETLWRVGVARAVDAAGPPDPGAPVDPILLELAQLGSLVSEDELHEAIAVREQLIEQFDAWFSSVDLLVAPVASCLPFEVENETPPNSGWTDWHDWMPWTYPFNLTGLPALSLPVAVSPTGLPVGVQLISGRHRDEFLLAIAAQLELSLGTFVSPMAG